MKPLQPSQCVDIRGEIFIQHHQTDACVQTEIIFTYDGRNRNSTLYSATQAEAEHNTLQTLGFLIDLALKAKRERNFK